MRISVAFTLFTTTLIPPGQQLSFRVPPSLAPHLLASSCFRAGERGTIIPKLPITGSRPSAINTGAKPYEVEDTTPTSHMPSAPANAPKHPTVPATEATLRGDRSCIAEM